MISLKLFFADTRNGLQAEGSQEISVAQHLLAVYGIGSGIVLFYAQDLATLYGYMLTGLA